MKRNQEAETPQNGAQSGAPEEKRDPPRPEKKAGAEQNAQEETEAKTSTSEQAVPDKNQPERAKAEDTGEDMKKELDTVRNQLKDTEDQLVKQKDVFMRTAAEYDNYRKRTQREKETVYADATADAVREFLAVEDNLERALAQKECSAEDLRKGVEMVQKQLADSLKKLGVSEMGSVGEEFDPALHSAVSHVEDKDAGENTITKVFQKGYKIGGKVVRHAMVQVAN